MLNVESSANIANSHNKVSNRLFTLFLAVNVETKLKVNENVQNLTYWV